MPALADLTWPETPGGALVLVPLGATEQHGPHLPLSTDTLIAEAVTARVAAELGAQAAPALPYGASGEHADFPGTVSLGHAALESVLVETVRSLALWAARVVFVTGHGGNVPALTSAVPRLRAEGHDTAWTSCALPGSDAHAGRTETSLLLAVAPHLVRLALAVPGDLRPLPELLPSLRAHGVRAVSPTGVLGDPTGATPAEGRTLLTTLTTTLTTRIRHWHPTPHGSLAPPRNTTPRKRTPLGQPTPEQDPAARERPVPARAAATAAPLEVRGLGGMGLEGAKRARAAEDGVAW